MTRNERITDCFGYHRPSLRPTCVPVNADDYPRLNLRTPTIDLATVRDLVFGPRLLAELAILRRLAA